MRPLRGRGSSNAGYRIFDPLRVDTNGYTGSAYEIGFGLGDHRFDDTHSFSFTVVDMSPRVRRTVATTRIAANAKNTPW